MRRAESETLLSPTAFARARSAGSLLPGASSSSGSSTLLRSVGPLQSGYSIHTVPVEPRPCSSPDRSQAISRAASSRPKAPLRRIAGALAAATPIGTARSATRASRRSQERHLALAARIFAAPDDPDESELLCMPSSSGALVDSTQNDPEPRQAHETDHEMEALRETEQEEPEDSAQSSPLQRVASVLLSQQLQGVDVYSSSGL